MDIQEEFQFKPLTEGLGFQKKSIELKDDMLGTLPTQTGVLPKSRASTSTSSQPTNTYGTLNRPSTVAASSQTISRPGTTPGPVTQRPTPRPVAAPGRWAPAMPQTNILENAKPKMPRLQQVASNWPAALFDSAMIAGMTLLFSAVVFALTKVEVSTLIETVTTDMSIQIATFAIVFAVFEIYTVTCRTFFAKTLGEWVFDSRLGDLEDQNKLSYPFRVAWRTFVITITGFVVLPALSSAVGVDLAGALSGVKLYAEDR